MNMKFRKRKLILVFLVGVLLTGMGVALPVYLENKVREKLAAAQGKASAIEVNVFLQTLTLHDLELYASAGKPVGVLAKTARLKGVSIIRWMLEREIVVHELMLDSGRIIFDRSLADTSKSKSIMLFKEANIHRILFRNIQAEIRTDTLIEFSALFNVKAGKLKVLEYSDAPPHYSLGFLECDVSSINISRDHGAYGMSIARFGFNSDHGKLHMDSILLIPNYEKFDFAHKIGQQVSRISLSVPDLTVEGISLDDITDSTLHLSKVALNSCDIHSFRDKRVPFLRKKPLPLPMESFKKLPWSIAIDSLLIRDTRIEVEEVAEDGDESGTVTFEHVSAVGAMFNNRYTAGDPKRAVLHARGLLMGTTDINASFSFPLDASPSYSAQGTVSSLQLDKLNPVFENLVRIRFESGTLNNLKFDFQYTDKHSNGKIEVDYENLKLTGLNRKNEKPNEVLTFLANTFVKNTRTSEDASKGKRTGEIDIERDRQRYIFNLWWKSILDGLKSSVLSIEIKK